MSSKDTDIYMKKIRSRASKSGTVMEKITQDRLAELDKLRIQAEMDEIRARSAESQAKSRRAIEGNQGHGKANYLQTLFVGKTPEQIQQILDNLTPENIQRLQLMSADPAQQATLLQLLGKSTSTTDTIQLIKLITDMNRQPNQGVTLQGMAAIIKSVRGEQKGSSMGDAVAVLKPIYDAIQQQSTKAYELHIKTLEAQSKNSPSLAQQLTQTRELATAMGLTSANKNPAFDLKLEEMRESHDIDMQRMGWEQKKYLLQQDADRDKWERIQETFAPILQMASPEIRNAIRKVGEDVGKSIGGQGKPEASSNQPQTASFTCPKCGENLNVQVPPGAAEEIKVKCPKCGTITPAKVSGTTPPQPEQAPPEEKPKGHLSYKSA